MGKDDHRIYKLNREIVLIQKDENEEVRIRNKKRKEQNKTYYYYLSLIPSFFIFLIGFSWISFIIVIILLLIGSTIDAYFESKSQLEEEELPYKEIKGEDYYSYEEYRYSKALNKVMSEENRKYQEAAEKQNKGKEEAIIYYNKDDEINMMVEMIEDYFRAYKLPPLRVKAYEWDVFFDTLFNEFSVRGIRNNYFYVVSESIRYTLANALVNEAEIINMQDFVNSLKYLSGTRTNEGIMPEVFTDEDVINIQEKIRMRIRRKKRKKENTKQLKNEL